MFTLTPHLPSDPRETPLSFAARLAFFHTGGRLLTFLSDLGVRPFDLRVGAGDAIDRLTNAAGVDAAALRRNTPVLIDRQTYDLRGHAVSSWFLSSPATVFCPVCLAGDDAAGDGPFHTRIGRFAWTLRAVRTCPVHGVALTRREKQAWDGALQEFAVYVPEHGPALDALADAAPRRAVSPLQAYILDRLDGAAGPAWLDAQTIEQALWVTETLGAVVGFGPRVKPSELTADQWDAAGRIGFACAAEGESGIRAALDTLIENATKRGGKAGPQNMFGPLYTCVAARDTRAERGDIRRILREHIFDRFELADGAMVLGAALPTRRLHSVASLAREAQLDTRTLRAVLFNVGLVDRARLDDPTVVFDAEAGRRLAGSVVRGISLLSLPKYLDCTRPLAEQIADERILPLLAFGAAEGAGRTGKAFDAMDVAQLIDDLRMAATPVRAEPTSMVPIAKAAEKAKIRAVDVVHLVLGGHLARVARAEEGEGIAALRVDPDEVKRVACALMTDLSPAAAFGMLRIPARSGWALIDGVGDVQLPHRRVIGAGGRHAFVRIRREDLDEFADRLTTIVRIADAMGRPQADVVAMLRAARVRYSVERRYLGIELIRRADLPAELAA
jgi:hypothetical protein